MQPFNDDAKCNRNATKLASHFANFQEIGLRQK